MRVGFTPTPAMRSSPGFGEDRGAHQERGGRGIAGHLDVERLDPAAGAELDPALALRHRVAERAQHPLGMVARSSAGFPQVHRYLADQAGQQQGALDLGARDRHRVPQRAQRAAPDRERQAVAAPLLEARAHFGERRGDAAHRAAAQRGIAGECRAEAVAGQQAEQEPRGRAGVAAIERPVGRAKPAAAPAP